MIIRETADANTLTLAVEGRLDTTTAPELEKAITKAEGFGKLVMDFTDLEYISSAGLRVVLKAHKLMDGEMVICGVNEVVNEVFEVTGFLDILTIE